MGTPRDKSSTPKNPPCVICGKKIHDGDNEVFRTPDGGLRHKKCGPGSKAWLAKYPERADNEINQLLTKTKTPAGKQQMDPMKQQIKEFVGRIKYMLYMDKVNKTPNYWTIRNLLLDLQCSQRDQITTYVKQQTVCDVQPIETLAERLYEYKVKP